MGQLVLGAVGAVVGGFFGGPTGAQIGWGLGSAIGGAVFAPKSQVQGPRIDDLRITGLEYGQTIPFVKGAPVISGQLWWSSDRREIATTTTQGGKGGPTVESTTFTYEADLLIGFTYNEMIGLAKLIIDGKLEYNVVGDAASRINSAQNPKWRRMTFYPGNFTQLPDPTYEAAVGAGLAPAYRGRCCIFFEGFQLGPSGRVPNIQAQIFSKGTAAGSDYFDQFADGLDAFQLDAGAIGNFSEGSTEYGPTIVGESVEQVSAISKDIPTTNVTYMSVLFSIIAVDLDDATALAINSDHDQFITINPRRETLNDPQSRPVLNLNGDNHIIASDALDVNVMYKLEVTIADNIADATHVTLTRVQDGGVIYDADVLGTYLYTEVNNVSIGIDGVGGSPSTSAQYTDLVLISTPGTIENETLQDTVEALCLRSGMDPAIFDVDDLASITKPVRGLAISAVTTTRQVLEYLASCYFFDSFTTDKEYFVPRGNAAVATLAFNDLGATESADPIESPFDITIGSEIELTAVASIGYMNADTDCARDVQNTDRLLTPNITTTVTAVPLVFTASEAKAIVDAWLLDARTARYTAPIALLTQDGTKYTPTDVFNVTDEDDRTFRMRVVRKRESGPAIDFDLVLDDTSVLEQLGITSADYSAPTTVDAVAVTRLEVLDIPILRDIDDGTGLYVAATGLSTPWPGAAVFKSVDGIDYNREEDVAESATIGNVGDALPDWTHGNIADESSVVDVFVAAGKTLSSVTHAQMVDESANACLIGSEVLNFRVATLIAPGQYRLQGLLRGRRGTEWAMIDHADGERFILLTLAGMRRISMTVSEIGATRYWRGVTLGQLLSSGTNVASEFDDIAEKPFSPVDPKGVRGVDLTSLLLHLNGTNGSTTITDSSNNAITMTCSGNAQITTAQSKFGGASADFDGTGDYITSAVGSTLDIGTIGSSSNHTLEGFFRFDNVAGSVHTIFAHAVTGSGGDGKGGYIMYEQSGKLNFQVSDISSASNPWIGHWQTSAAVVTTATWYHIAFVIVNGVPKIFVDGVEKAGAFQTPNGQFGSTFIGRNTTRADYGLRLGATNTDSSNPTPGSAIDGQMDEIRVSIGTARYTADFTAPIAQFDDPAAAADLIMYWSRRSRLEKNFSNGNVPLGEESEEYEIDVFDDNTYTTLVRTLTATDSQVEYTAAQQITDFGGAQSQVYAKVYQMSAVVGRGYPLTAVF